MKVLVTGGAGYIGSVVAEALIGAKHEVVVFDNLFQGHRAAVPPQAVFVEGDLGRRSAIEAALAAHQPDAVMHFAARSIVGESMEQPLRYLGDNVIHGIHLLESVVEHGVERFILSSTANLYGKPERVPIPENDRIAPGSPYGESKLYLERMLEWLQETRGLRYASLRYFNAAGATEARGEDHRPERHLIPLVLQVALGQRDSIKIFGDGYDTPDGTCIRDYIHVVDLAQAHILALDALGTQSRCVYNLGNGRGYSVKEVIETARVVANHPIPAVVVAPRPGDPAVLVASSEKIRRELGWEPKHPSLDSIVSSAWHWHQRHPRGYDDAGTEQ